MVDHGTGRLLALCLSVAGLLAMPADVGAAARTTVATSHTYASGDPEGTRVLEWIAAHSPDRRPVVRNGAVVVETKQHVPGSLASIGAPDSVPTKGNPGDAYTVKSTFADGTTQAWDYRWVARPAGEDGWSLAGYAFRKGSAPVETP